MDSYYISTQNKISVHDVIFNLGLQYMFTLSSKSNLTLGASMNFGSKLGGKRTFRAYKINSSTSGQQTLDNELLSRGYITYPFRIVGGFSYDYKDKWNLAGDYTYQRMSQYEEFGENQEFQDYHKGSLGVSLLPARYGRYWWQRNKYILGTYAVRSQIRLNHTNINTYALTLGTQIPVYIPNRELLLGIAFDFGVRGTEANGLIRENFGKSGLILLSKKDGL